MYLVYACKRAYSWFTHRWKIENVVLLCVSFKIIVEVNILNMYLY